MSTSTQRRYPSRAKASRECTPAAPNEPMGAVAREMVNTGRTRSTRQQQQQQQQQPKRIPALTTSRTFGSKSPIVDADIQAFLAKCMSTSQWCSYTEREKE